MLKRVVTVGLALMLVGLAGCAELRDLRKQNANLTNQVASLQSEKGQLLEENGALQALRDSLQASLTKVSQEAKQMADLVNELRSAEENSRQQALELKRLLADLEGVQLEQRSGRTFIVLASDILFAPGRDELSPEASAALDKVADYLLGHPGLQIRIDGHTDGVPITHSPWKDNYHLGGMRALAVMRYLTGKGLDSARVHIVSFGPNKPYLEPEEPTADVAENRRVEILLVPEEMRSIGEMLEAFGK